MSNFYKRIYDLRVEIINEIYDLIKKSGKKTILMDDVFNMCCDCDYIDVTLIKCKYDGLVLTFYDEHGYDYGIDDFSSVDALAFLHTTIEEALNKK